MGVKPFHSGARGAVRRMVVLVNVIALLLAPLVVSLTHSPVISETTSISMASAADEIVAHGHAHDEAPDNGMTFPIDGHDATDHEHQLQALVVQTASTQQLFSKEGRSVLADNLRQLIPDGPKRPPRTV